MPDVIDQFRAHALRAPMTLLLSYFVNPGMLVRTMQDFAAPERFTDRGVLAIAKIVNEASDILYAEINRRCPAMD